MRVNCSINRKRLPHIFSNISRVEIEVDVLWQEPQEEDFSGIVALPQIATTLETLTLRFISLHRSVLVIDHGKAFLRLFGAAAERPGILHIEGRYERAGRVSG
jgi:hypothetical protein